MEVFDQDMQGEPGSDRRILDVLSRFKVRFMSKDTNANTITHYVGSTLKHVKRVVKALKEEFPNAEINTRKVADGFGYRQRYEGVRAFCPGPSRRWLMRKSACWRCTSACVRWISSLWWMRMTTRRRSLLCTAFSSSLITMSTLLSQPELP